MAININRWQHLFLKNSFNCDILDIGDLKYFYQHSIRFLYNFRIWNYKSQHNNFYFKKIVIVFGFRILYWEWIIYLNFEGWWMSFSKRSTCSNLYRKFNLIYHTKYVQLVVLFLFSLLFESSLFACYIAKIIWIFQICKIKKSSWQLNI